MLKLPPLMDPGVYNEAFVENSKQLKDSVLNTTRKIALSMYLNMVLVASVTLFLSL